MNSYSIKELREGQTDSLEFEVKKEMAEPFAALTGDINPLHTDEKFAAETPFGGCIAHGMLTAGFISAVIGTKLPGLGSIYMSQSLNFLAPVRYGDTVTAIVTVKEILAEKRRVVLETICRNQEGRTVLSGEAVVRPREEEK